MITLKEAKVGMADKVVAGVIDGFRQESPLMDKLVFDDCVSPSGGSTLTYGYLRTSTPAVAGFRALNTEYSAQEAKREKHTVELKVFGGAFQIDRVLATTSGLVDEVNWQMQQKIKAARNLFHHTLINGDSTVDTKAFDGLDKALVGSDTECNTGSYLDLSTSAAMTTNYHAALDALDAFLGEITGEVSFLLVNAAMKAKLAGLARRAGCYKQDRNEFGRQVEYYNGIPIQDIGYYVKIEKTGEGASATETVSEVPSIPVVSRKIGEAQVTGLTDVYAVSLAQDGLHGVTVSGGGIVRAYPPNLKLPGAVKTGEVEMVAAMALKRTRAAAVLRNVKIK